MATNQPRRHHLISVSHLKAWAIDGSRVRYIDKEALSYKLVGIKDISVVRDLLTVRLDSGPSTDLEVAFGRVESRAVPLVRELVQGADSPEHHAAVKAIIALHFARSASLQQTYQAMREERIDEMIAEAEGDAELSQAYMADHGKTPTVQELRELIRHQADEFKNVNLHFVELVQRIYIKTLDYFEPMHLQRAHVIKPNRAELLLSDSPVVVNDGEGGSADRPVALDDADLLWFPLSPIFGASLTTEPQPSVDLNEEATRILNKRVWDFASRYVIAGTDTHINRSLGYSSPKLTLSHR